MAAQKAIIEFDTQIQPPSRRHLRDEVYQILWRQIVHGRIEPGSAIVEEDVASKLGVSRTPVREALHRLEYDGLVAPGPNGRPLVTPPTAADIEEIYPLIGALEGLAARQAIAHLTDADLDRMDEFTAAMTRHAKRGEIEELMIIDEQFHELIHERSQNRRLLKIVRELRGQMERFEYAFFSDPKKLAASMERHRQLVSVLRKRDPKLIQRTIEANWEAGRVALLEISDAEQKPQVTAARKAPAKRRPKK